MLLEVAGKDGLDEAVEDDLGAVGLGQGHPQHEHKLEGVVEGEPVDDRQGRFDDGEEGVGDPVGQPLGIVGLGSAEQSLEGVVGGDGKAGRVDEELGADVEED